ncbi:flagellar basal-body MS-ring/collar protein FliF [Magnetovibrio sp. PR-2]|uniref:flagellar basal-body MS-ring/collar protein FliF n=1 Tax=Magnetovibrio sp. PR-2 TaxID=3120356 RepID=UPI002FCE44F6
MDALAQTIRNLGPARIAIMGVVLFALVGFFIYMVTRFSSPPMAELYGNLEPQDSARVISQLQTQGIAYESLAGGARIMVPTDQAARIRLIMAENGLPSSGTIGWELFDKQGTLGTTNFQQNVNKIRALEGELIRTIETIDKVRTARVHLVMPTRKLFDRKSNTPTASIFLKMRGAMRLDASQIQAVQHLVAAAVPELLPSSISIVDDKGSLLARGFEGDPSSNPSLVAQKTDERRRAAEREMQTAIEQILEKSVGFGKVQAEVTLDMDFDRITTNEERYDPDGQVVRATSTVEQTAASKDSENQAVTVDNNLPDGGGIDGDQTSRSSNDNRTEENVSFEISKTVTNKIRDVGIINRISASVVVDGAWELDENDDRIYRERTEAEMENLSKLVRAAIGFDTNRGDIVEVVNMKFADPDIPEPEPLDLFLGLEKQDMLQFAEMIVILILAILVILLVIRPLISRAFEALPGAMSQMAEGGRMIADQAQLAAGALAAPPSPEGAVPEEEMFEELIDIDRVEGRVKASSVKKVGEIVEKHPDEALSIVRNWLYQEG